SGLKKRQGYCVLVAEAAGVPEERRSLRPLGRSMQLEIHDRPLAVLGFPGEGGKGDRMGVVRPRHTGGPLSAVTRPRLDIGLRHPTMHDSEVLGLAAWQPYRGDEAAQLAVDEALDVERVTKAFHRGLIPHFDVLAHAVEACGAANVVVQAGIDGA